MKAIWKNCVHISILLAVFSSSPGQSPALFNYQGVVRDNQNNPLNGHEISVRLSVLRDSEQGDVEYSETHSITTGELGQFNVLVGDGTHEAGSIAAIDWGASSHYLKVEVDPENAGEYTLTGISQLVSVPYAMHAGNFDQPLRKLEVIEQEGGVGEEALFEVRREDGSVVFAVYNEGVRIYVDEAVGKGAKGGFAVGGYNSAKGYTSDYLWVTPDSVRIYVEDGTDKGVKGGFAVGGYNSTKGKVDPIMNVSRDSVRIYVNDQLEKGIKGGFAVGGYKTTKNGSSSFLQLDPNNYFIGHQAGANNTTGIYNSFFGYQAGFNNTTGENNLFQGYSSGFSNISGVNNIFMGFNSGFSNIDGEANVFIGNEAGFWNTEGDLNAFVGNQAGYSSTTGNYNTFLGFWTGYSNTTGNLNTYIGAEAGRQTIDGEVNTIVGAYAGAEYNLGSHNTFLGNSAGRYNKGARNTLLGSQSGVGNEDGDENIMIGFYAGESSVGSSNIFIGNNAGNASNGWNNIFIGQHAGFGMQRSNRLVIDNFATADSSQALIYGEIDNRVVVMNANVGIGTYPEVAFQVGGDFKVEGSLRSNGIAFGSSFGPKAEYYENGNFLAFGDPGISEDFIGYKNNTFYFLDSPGGGDISDPDVVFGSNVTVDSGSVAIGLIFPTEKLDVDGSARFRNVGFGAPAFDLALADDGTLVKTVSDERLKTEFRELDNSLEKILSMHAYSFEWKDQTSGKRDIGFKAQEMEKILPEAVFKNPKDGYLGINYSRIPVLLVEAIKEQQKIIDEKDQKIMELEERLSRIEKELFE